MNKIIVTAVVILSCLQGLAYAQEQTVTPYKKRYNASKTEKTFNMWDAGVNIRDFVFLKDGEMIIDLQKVKDFERVRNIYQVLMDLKNDIAFYKDSLENTTNNVRIDYVITDHSDHKEIRFTQHRSAGDIYVNKNGQTSRLKMEQDTVRIIMWLDNDLMSDTTKRKRSNSSRMCCVNLNKSAVQVTFCLNNYMDIEKLILDRENITKAIDTLIAIQEPGTVQRPDKFPSSAIYRPYATTGPVLFKRKRGVMQNETDYYGDGSTIGPTIVIDGNVGVGLAMNTLCPTADIRILLADRWRKGDRSTYSFGGISFAPYFFFGKDAVGNLQVNDNWFVNAEFGAHYGKWYTGSKGDIATLGFGYLLKQKGDYFHGPTFKVFTNIKINDRMTISPELIATNNFKQIFPGLTLKMF